MRIPDIENFATVRAGAVLPTSNKYRYMSGIDTQQLDTQFTHQSCRTLVSLSPSVGRKKQSPDALRPPTRNIKFSFVRRVYEGMAHKLR